MNDGLALPMWISSRSWRLYRFTGHWPVLILCPLDQCMLKSKAILPAPCLLQLVGGCLAPAVAATEARWILSSLV